MWNRTWLGIWRVIRCSDGIKIHEKASGIHSHYSEDNRIQKVVNVNDCGLIVTDEMGSVPNNTYIIIIIIIV